MVALKTNQPDSPISAVPTFFARPGGKLEHLGRQHVARQEEHEVVRAVVVERLPAGVRGNVCRAAAPSHSAQLGMPSRRASFVAMKNSGRT